ncbi:unnamed protein product [Moneuplotes crassus]|uniref:Uncharacterized protein n=1 Tax=Euplotes crassus TaxID=5936 RepID=A0AAD1Y4A8_EUPCR|nr:unnamed protein product [Moneuplotes crassus]
MNDSYSDSNPDEEIVLIISKNRYPPIQTKGGRRFVVGYVDNVSETSQLRHSPRKVALNDATNTRSSSIPVGSGKYVDAFMKNIKQKRLESIKNSSKNRKSVQKNASSKIGFHLPSLGIAQCGQKSSKKNSPAFKKTQKQNKDQSFAMQKQIHNNPKQSAKKKKIAKSKIIKQTKKAKIDKPVKKKGRPPKPETIDLCDDESEQPKASAKLNPKKKFKPFSSSTCERRRLLRETGYFDDSDNDSALSKLDFYDDNNDRDDKINKPKDKGKNADLLLDTIAPLDKSDCDKKSRENQKSNSKNQEVPENNSDDLFQASDKEGSISEDSVFGDTQKNDKKATEKKPSKQTNKDSSKSLNKNQKAMTSNLPKKDSCQSNKKKSAKPPTDQDKGKMKPKKILKRKKSACRKPRPKNISDAEKKHQSNRTEEMISKPSSFTPLIYEQPKGSNSAPETIRIIFKKTTILEDALERPNIYLSGGNLMKKRQKKKNKKQSEQQSTLPREQDLKDNPTKESPEKKENLLPVQQENHSVCKSNAPNISEVGDTCDTNYDILSKNDPAFSLNQECQSSLALSHAKKNNEVSKIAEKMKQQEEKKVAQVTPPEEIDDTKDDEIQFTSSEVFNKSFQKDKKKRKTISHSYPFANPLFCSEGGSEVIEKKRDAKFADKEPSSEKIPEKFCKDPGRDTCNAHHQKYVCYNCQDDSFLCSRCVDEADQAIKKNLTHISVEATRRMSILSCAHEQANSLNLLHLTEEKIRATKKARISELNISLAQLKNKFDTQIREFKRAKIHEIEQLDDENEIWKDFPVMNSENADIKSKMNKLAPLQSEERYFEIIGSVSSEILDHTTKFQQKTSCIRENKECQKLRNISKPLYEEEMYRDFLKNLECHLLEDRTSQVVGVDGKNCIFLVKQHCKTIYLLDLKSNILHQYSMLFTKKGRQYSLRLRKIDPKLNSTSQVSSLITPYDIKTQCWNESESKEYFQGVKLNDGRYFIISTFGDRKTRLFETVFNGCDFSQKGSFKHLHINSAVTNYNNECLFAIGSCNISLNDEYACEMYNLDTDIATVLPKLNYNRTGHSVINIDRYIYVFGGMNLFYQTYPSCFERLQIHNGDGDFSKICQNQWKKINFKSKTGDSPCLLHNCGVAKIGSKDIIIFGGISENNKCGMGSQKYHNPFSQKVYFFNSLKKMKLRPITKNTICASKNFSPLARLRLCGATFTALVSSRMVFT